MSLRTEIDELIIQYNGLRETEPEHVFTRFSVLIPRLGPEHDSMELMDERHTEAALYNVSLRLCGSESSVLFLASRIVQTAEREDGVWIESLPEKGEVGVANNIRVEEGMIFRIYQRGGGDFARIAKTNVTMQVTNSTLVPFDFPI